MEKKMSIADYAKKFNCHTSSVRRWIADGTLKGEKTVGGKWFVIVEAKKTEVTDEDKERKKKRELVDGLDRKEIRELLKKEMVVDYLATDDLKLRATTSAQIIKMYGYDKDSLTERQQSLIAEVYDRVMDKLPEAIEKAKGLMPPKKPKQEKEKK